MTTPTTILSELATAVLLFRDHPDWRDEQKAAFKRFATAYPDQDNTLRLTPLGFRWNGADVAASTGELSALHSQLSAHGIGEIRVPVGLMTSTLLSLIRILAAPVGTYGSLDHLIARLDAAGVGIVQVLPPPTLEPESDLPATLLEPIQPSTIEPAVLDVPRTAKLDEDRRINILGPDALNEAGIGMMHFASLQPHNIDAASDIVVDLAGAANSDERTRKLNELVVAGENAAHQSEWKELLRAAYGLVELERGEEKGSPSRSYGIALRRLLPHSALERIGYLTAHGNMKSEATAVMRRMGADGTEVLLNLLVNSEEMLERRAYFSALKEMSEGGPLLVHMLSHDQWFVVRNVAELCGELREEKAIPSLARLSPLVQGLERIVRGDAAQREVHLPQHVSFGFLRRGDRERHRHGAVLPGVEILGRLQPHRRGRIVERPAQRLHGGRAPNLGQRA
ncbi:MAG TPA: HEAT repeat domain-containing protein, partial [Gemmatimonadales bacterium]|nr:HEAT repeat domain-containing protein [Gemmatimonadales bacterium]